MFFNNRSRLARVRLFFIPVQKPCCHKASTLTRALTSISTATETAYLGGQAGLAAPLGKLVTKPLMGPEFMPPVAPLAQPVTTTHRLISYTSP